jgi:small subunit ribosomal protein S14
MARKAMVEKEKKRKLLTDQKWEKRQEYKKIISSPFSDPEAKLDAMLKLDKLPKNSSPIRLRNRCQFTGRSRGYLRKFQMSRLCFREMALAGELPGIFKASW